MHRIINIDDVASTTYSFYYELLSTEKRMRVDRFHFEDDKKRSVVGDMLAKEMISEYCKIPVQDIQLQKDTNGKPFVKDLGVEFNISHSGKYVICAISDKPIGVDIEQIRELDLSISKKFCNDKELKYIFDGSISKKESIKRFFEIWTFKEAYLKMLGVGLSFLDNTPDFFKCKKNTINVNGYIICIINKI